MPSAPTQARTTGPRKQFGSRASSEFLVGIAQERSTGRARAIQYVQKSPYATAAFAGVRPVRAGASFAGTTRYPLILDVDAVAPASRSRYCTNPNRYRILIHASRRTAC